ncbi:MAG: D-glycero-beta-D-manno-heptose 1-phosphate adenylyltransferase [Pseudomonadota bacterium]
MDRDKTASLLARIAGRRALCVGDVIFDEFVYGETRRISREAPVPVLSESRRATMLGGAGNLARNIVTLGGQAKIISVCGDDERGLAIRALLKNDLGDASGLIDEAGRATPGKTRYVSNGQQVLCVDKDPNRPISDETTDRLRQLADRLIADSDVVVISDYGRGMVTPGLSKAVIEAARTAGVPVCVDPRGTDYSRYDGADLIKPNAAELAEEAGIEVNDDASAEAALSTVLGALKTTSALIATRGGRGMSLLKRGGAVTHHRARPRSVFDVSGAGDTALAALSLCMAGGIDLEDAIGLADLAAGAAVGKAGTACVNPDEVLAEAVGGSAAPGWRVPARSDAAELAQGWRAEGLRVGFTNGCFDILHPGHLSVLRFAKAACDRLIVGLNSDASVRRLKGAERPINNAEDRALMLASLESVDRVVVFEEDTPEALIQAIRPDVLIKGADYQADDLPGAAFIKSYGGEVRLAPLEAGRSTTALVERLKSGAAD